MIWESSYWKKDLIIDAGVIEKWAKKKYSTKRYVILEKKIFIAAYSIRKLIESGKINPHYPMWKFSVDVHKKINSDKINFFNSDRIDKFYDLNKRQSETIDLLKLSNQIIHGYVFNLLEDEDENVVSFYVVSDWEKDQHLFEISIHQFTNVLKWIGYSDIYSSECIRKPNSTSGFDFTHKYSFEECIPLDGLIKKDLVFTRDLIEKN